jgi:hypothetical protein
MRNLNGRACPQPLGKPRREIPRKRTSSTRCADFPQRRTALLGYLIFFCFFAEPRESATSIGTLITSSRSRVFVPSPATCSVSRVLGSPIKPKKSGSSGRAVGAVESPRPTRWQLAFRGNSGAAFQGAVGRRAGQAVAQPVVNRASARLSIAPPASISPDVAPKTAFNATSGGVPGNRCGGRRSASGPLRRLRGSTTRDVVASTAANPECRLSHVRSKA